MQKKLSTIDSLNCLNHQLNSNTSNPMNTTRKIILSSLIAFFFLPSYAQELKTKKILTGNCLEVFTIDKKSKLKNGEYLKLENESRDTLVSGTFLNDQKTGTWKYNGKGSKPWITYDYDKKMLNPISDEITKVDSFMIRIDNTFVSEKVDSPPLYIGYKDEVRNILANNFKIPVDILVNGLSDTSVASFVVDKNGKMTDFRIEKMKFKEVSTIIMSAYKKIEGEWMPAIFKGQPVDSKIFVVFDIKPFGTPSAMPKIPNSLEIVLTYFGVKRAPMEIGSSSFPGSNTHRR